MNHPGRLSLKLWCTIMTKIESDCKRISRSKKKSYFDYMSPCVTLALKTASLSSLYQVPLTKAEQFSQHSFRTQTHAQTDDQVIPIYPPLALLWRHGKKTQLVILNLAICEKNGKWKTWPPHFFKTITHHPALLHSLEFPRLPHTHSTEKRSHRWIALWRRRLGPCLVSSARWLVLSEKKKNPHQWLQKT